MNGKELKINVIAKLILSIIILTSMEKVNAVNVTGDIGSGSASGVSGYYDALWSGHLYEFEFRVTLVDENGIKVENTNSVDYGYNNDSTTYQLTGNDLNNKMNTSLGFNYKYGSNTGNYSYYKAKLANGYYYNYYSQYDAFVQEFQTMIKNRNKQFGIAHYTSGNFDFLTMFLYHCGYLNSDDGTYYDIEDAKWTEKRKEIAKKNYYLLIEPIFTISGRYYVHGTSTEMARFLLSTGTIPQGLMSAFTYTIGMGMTSNAQEIQNLGFKPIKYGDPSLSASTFFRGGATNAQVINEWQVTANPEYGYGVGTLKISQVIPNPPEEENIDIYFSKDYCQETTGNNNTAKISFELSNNLEQSIYRNTKEAGYKYKKYSETSNIYCYDNVTYDFSNTINSLNKTIATPLSYVTIPNGTITINRKCFIASSNAEFDTAKINFLDNFNEYENQTIPLKVYNSTLDLKEKNITKTEDATKLLSGLGNKNGVYNITATITFGYNGPDSKVLVPADYGDGTAAIDFSNVTFGYSKDLMKQVQEGQEYKYGIYIFKTHVTSTPENMNCKFKTTVEDKKNVYDPETIIFRTIDLDNPFPGRDGSSRLPGLNWLSKDNYVRTYINHNRGVTGSEVYDKEPIYSITLTPSTIIKIRNYNKTHTYSDIGLTCLEDNNTSCLSNFLRSTVIPSSDKTGTCMINSVTKDPNGIGAYDANDVAQTIINRTDKFANNYTTEELKYDFNNDGILTLRDAYIYDYAEYTTSYYTCADKTYENSGYIQKSGYVMKGE